MTRFKIKIRLLNKLIISIDHMINNYNEKAEEMKAIGDIEDVIRLEIEREPLLSANEKKTIEVLVIDYFRNGKSVLDLIRLDKLEEDLKSHEFDDEDKRSGEDSEERDNADLLWKLPESDQYYELLTQKVPNKYERINEIKYKIPMKWTKKFNVDDIVPHKEKLNSAIISEGGMVNNYLKLKRKLMAKKCKKKTSDRLSESVHPPTSQLNAGLVQDISTPQDTNFNKISDSKDMTIKEKNLMNYDEDIKSSPKFNDTDGFNEMRKKPIFTNQPDGQNVPLSNMMLKESLSSKQDSPRMQTIQGVPFPKPGQSEESKTLLQKQKQHITPDDNAYGNKDKINIQEQSLNIAQGTPSYQQESRFDHKRDIDEEKANLTDHEVVADRTRGMNFEFDQHQPDSPRTDANYDEQRADLLSREGKFDYAQIKPLYKPPKYNIDEIGHLFMEGKIPDEIYNIEDPMEYNYLLVKLKKEFNDQTRSEFLKYMNLQLPYNSRRDEVGGIITDEDWSDFIFRVEKIIKRVRRKRLRIIRRRKKNGKRLMPRKTLFKPMKRPNLAKDPLWKEIFLDESSEDSTVEDTDIFDDKGIENDGKFRLPPLYQPLVKGNILIYL